MDVGAHVSSRAFRNDRAPRVRGAAAPPRARRSARCRGGSARADPRSSRPVSMPETSPSRVTVLPPTISSLMWRMVERANKRSSGSRSGRSRSASSLSQSMTSRSAGAPGASTPPSSSLVTERRPLTRTAFRSVFRSTSTQNPVPACSRSARRISRSASSSSSSVAPSRPSATRQPRFTISASGAMPERRCKFEEVLTEIVTLALGQQLKLVRPRPGAMRQRQALAEKADRVEIFDDAVRKIPVRPLALIARLEQMHVDAAPACSRRLAQCLPAVRPSTIGRRPDRTARRRSGSDRLAATASTSASCSLTGSGGRMKRRSISARASSGRAARIGSDGP